MASKGQKLKNHSQATIDKVLAERAKGRSVSYLSSKYQIAEGTIATWSHKLKIRGTSKKQNKGRLKDSLIDYKERYQILKKFQAFLVKRPVAKK